MKKSSAFREDRAIPPIRWATKAVQERVSVPLINLLKTGVSPREIALGAALGSMIGVFPILGTTTLLCTALALWLRLNLIAVQAFNWLVAGVQLLLILPFMRLGAQLFGTMAPNLSSTDLQEVFQQGMGAAVQTLGISLAHAVTGWALFAPLVFYTVYRIVYITLAQRATMAQKTTA